MAQGNGPTAVESKIGYQLSGQFSPCKYVDTIEVLHVGITHHFQDTTTTNHSWDVVLTGTVDAIPRSTTTALVNEQCIADYINSCVHHQADGLYCT